MSIEQQSSRPATMNDLNAMQQLLVESMERRDTWTAETVKRELWEKARIWGGSLIALAVAVFGLIRLGMALR